MKRNPDVDRWFDETKPPAEKALGRVRDVILRADPRMIEYLEYGTVIFGYNGDCVSFVQQRKPGVDLMFNRGARIPGKFPHLEGSGPTARFMWFKDVAEGDTRTAELGKIATAWCNLMAAEAKPQKQSDKR